MLIPDEGFGHWERLGWLLADVTGDGLDDLVISHPRPGDAAVNDWWIATNTGCAFATPEIWASFACPSGPPGRWDTTAVDIDQDGLTDIFLDAQVDGWSRYTWLHANSDHAVSRCDTGVPRPPGAEVDFDDEQGKYRFMRLGDVNGDGVADAGKTNGSFSSSLRARRPQLDDAGLGRGGCVLSYGVAAGWQREASGSGA